MLTSHDITSNITATSTITRTRRIGDFAHVVPRPTWAFDIAETKHHKTATVRIWAKDGFLGKGGITFECRDAASHNDCGKREIHGVNMGQPNLISPRSKEGTHQGTHQGPKPCEAMALGDMALGSILGEPAGGGTRKLGNLQPVLC